MNILSSKNELSNNYNLEMEIDGKKWKNVSHYVYSNLLNYENHKRILKNNLREISKNFHELADKEEEDLIVESLLVALPVKFSNIEIARKLIATGEAPIVYRSSNTKLGVDEKGNGKNIYGKLLMRFRKTLKGKTNLDYRVQGDEKVKEMIYRSYLVKYMLEDYMYKGMDISRFTDMNVDDIYDLVAGDYDDSVPSEIYNSFQNYKKSLDKLSKDIVLGFVEPELKSNPEKVVQFVLKNKLRNMQIILKERRKNIIYNKYLENFLTKKGLNNDKVKSAFESYSEVFHNKERFENYLEQAYNNDVLPKKLQVDIYDILKNMRIPTDNEVMEAESVVFVIKKEPTQQIPKPPVQQAPVGGNKNQSSTDRFLDSLLNPPKRRDDVQKQQEPEETKGETEPKKHIRPIRRSQGSYQNEPPLSTQNTKGQSGTIKNKDIRAILDAAIEGREIPSDILNKYTEEPNKKSIVLDSNISDIYFDLCPVSYDMLFLSSTEENKRLFPSVSHYLMYRIIRNLVGNSEQSYDMIILNKNDGGNVEFAPLDVINHRYKDAILAKYSQLLKRAVDVKMNNPDIVQALANTGKVHLYYNDKNDEILGSGNNLTGVYLMNVRSMLNITGSVEKSPSQLELFVKNEDVWVEERVKDYCNAILNFGNLSDDNVAINIINKIYPCQFPDVDSNEVPRYFTKMVREESSTLSSNIVAYMWRKILSICKYVLEHSRNPKKMLEKASLVVQSQAFSKIKDKNKAVENAIINIATKLKEVENRSELSNANVKVATYILLKRRYLNTEDIQFDVASDGGVVNGDDVSSQGTADYSDDGSEQGSEQGSKHGSDYGDIYGQDAPNRSGGDDSDDEDRDNAPLNKTVLATYVKEVLNDDIISENIKQGRINFFQMI
jgi:predicted NAD-dependent protein-ADP-ribosyltransferase YbiA (DUF1768 family)